MASSRYVSVVVATLIGAGWASDARAQAFCALRDPVQTIYGFYPEATTYRSIVATVGEEARAAIAKRIRGGLHHGELGQHTLYVALAHGRPLGFVHVRTERTRWGLAEIAWALDLDVRVVDVRIQRSRSSSRAAVESAAFRAALRGQSDETLARFLLPGKDAVSVPGVALTEADQDLAAALVRSGIKTILATEQVWGDDIQRIRASLTGN